MTNSVTLSEILVREHCDKHFKKGVFTRINSALALNLVNGLWNNDRPYGDRKLSTITAEELLNVYPTQRELLNAPYMGPTTLTALIYLLSLHDIKYPAP